MKMEYANKIRNLLKTDFELELFDSCLNNLEDKPNKL